MVSKEPRIPVNRRSHLRFCLTIMHIHNGKASKRFQAPDTNLLPVDTEYQHIHYIILLSLSDSAAFSKVYRESDRICEEDKEILCSRRERLQSFLMAHETQNLFDT